MYEWLAEGLEKIGMPAETTSLVIKDLQAGLLKIDETGLVELTPEGQRQYERFKARKALQDSVQPLEGDHRKKAL